MGENRRIAKNTVFLYFRMMLVMFVGLFTSRVTLRVLGVEDYGLANVVGGIVAMLGFLNGCAAGATSRFLTFALGQERTQTAAGERYDYRATFSAAFVIHVALALLIIALGETVGVWYFNHRLVIPAGREHAAFWMYQLSVFSVLVGFTQVPYGASIIAHEKMDIYAYMGIFDAIMKLVNAYLLTIAPWDKLIFISTWGFLQSTGIAFFYRFYCIRTFGKKCRLAVVFDRTLYRRLLSYSGWDFIGNFGSVARSHGVNLILNLFCGPAVNAARGVAYAVEGAIAGFTGNFMMAVRPAIVKNYAAGDLERMLSLFYATCKFAPLLFSCFAIPIMIEAPTILELWLGTPPEYAEAFVRIVLAIYMVSCVNIVIGMAVHATGDVKRLNLFAGTKIFPELAGIYICLKFRCNPTSAFWVMLVGSSLIMAVNLWVLHKNITAVSVWGFLARVPLQVLTVILIGAGVSYSIHVIFCQRNCIWLRLILVLASYCLSLIPIVYWFLLSDDMRMRVRTFVVRRIASRCLVRGHDNP